MFSERHYEARSTMNESEDQNATIRVLPSDISFEIRVGESVMDAAKRNGVRWPTICNGAAECGVCAMEIISTTADLDAMTDRERNTLIVNRAWDGGSAERLACCTHPTDGELVVHRRSVRWEQ